MATSPIGTVNLEGLMSRANILFTNGYCFHGELHLENWQTSVSIITVCIEKFHYRLRYEAQNDFYWYLAELEEQPVALIDSDDIDASFKELCRRSLSLAGEQRHCPMTVTLIRDRADSRDFMLAQTCDQTYLDPRSAETVFNLIVDYYNALCWGEAHRLPDIVAAAKQGKTLDGGAMAALLGADGHDRAANIDSLRAYPVADVGNYAIPLDLLPDCLARHKKQSVAPIVQFFDIKQLVDDCRSTYPDVTKNSVICAALAKGFYNFNCRENNEDKNHLISFRMLSDLLHSELRLEYLGNYIAFVPISVEGSQPIADMARDIDARVRHCKDSKLDLTLFELAEAAVEAAQIGTINDPRSFIVANWSNYSFLKRPVFLQGCESLRHQSGANMAPHDTVGGSLVNRPIVVINLSPNDELCLSFCPSLRGELENRDLADQIGAVFYDRQMSSRQKLSQAG